MRRGARALVAGLLLLAVGLVPSMAQPSGAGALEPTAEPFPGQSVLPAPPSAAKRVIENVHTDAVSAYLDDGRLVLDSRADVDGELGKRFGTGSVLFHLSDAGAIEVPADPGYAFLGAAGSRVWMSPQTQDPNVIWAGFSTEDTALRGRAEHLDISLVEVEGPGRVEVFMQGAASPERVFSSSEQLAAWRIGVPQHTHMNWAFTAAGSYTLTFEAAALVDGVLQRASNRYTFVVGDLAAHARSVAVSLAADTAQTDPGEPIAFTAELEPSAAGAVQFRDTVHDTILGHSPVADGVARFRTAALSPGEHRIVAEFVPTWSTDALPAESAPLAVLVRGEAIPEPDHEDAQPVSDEELAAAEAGAGIRVRNADATLPSTGELSVRIDDPSASGDWVSLWAHGAQPRWLGWVQTDLAGGLALPLPEGFPPGEYRLVAKDRDGALLGWDRFTATGDAAPVDPGEDPGGTDPAPAPATPQPAAQECAPGVILDHGHIDAFNVSAGGGEAVLQVKEDVTGHQVLREAETVLLRVKESAYVAAFPAGTPGGPAGYVLPLSQNAELIWPGWDTNRTNRSGYSDVSIHITGVQGPGTVSLYTQGSFGGWRSLLTNGGYTLPGTLHEPAPAHTHAQWVFSQRGVYTLTVHAVATNPNTGASLTTAVHSYVFQVGDVPLGDVFCGLSAYGADTAQRVLAAVLSDERAAVAAEQAEVETAEQEARRRDGTRNSAAKDGAEPLAGILGTGIGPWALAGILGGGALALAGIVGATVWYLRGLRPRPAPEPSEHGAS